MIGTAQLKTASMSGRKFPRRGEIYWVDLEPARGAETRKRRPGLIISNDDGNELSNIVIIAPITSKILRIYPFEVATNVNGKAAKIMLNQCRAIDQSRLSEKIETIDDDTLDLVEEAIRIVFAIQ